MKHKILLPFVTLGAQYVVMETAFTRFPYNVNTLPLAGQNGPNRGSEFMVNALTTHSIMQSIVNLSLMSRLP